MLCCSLVVSLEETENQRVKIGPVMVPGIWRCIDDAGQEVEEAGWAKGRLITTINKLASTMTDRESGIELRRVVLLWLVARKRHDRDKNRG